MIEVENVHKSFGTVRALRGLSMTARDGAVTALIGPNGAGKTTAFRIVYGLLTPESGRVQVDGIDVVADRMAAQQRIGALPDVRGLYPRLTGREHVRYFGRLHGLHGRHLEDRIDELAERLDMGEFIDRPTRGFSRGQQLKVALARALVHAPGNVILDEPTNGLDVASSRAVRRLIREMRDAGHCILVSSHIMSEVTALSDRMIIVSDGREIMSGTLAEMRSMTGREDLEEVFLSAIGAGDGADDETGGDADGGAAGTTTGDGD